MTDRRLFGTDGIRGVAGQYPLSSKDVLALGRCAGQVLCEESGKARPRVLIVRDTRWSGPELLRHLSQGLRESGVDVFDAGVLCTPAVAHLVTHDLHATILHQLGLNHERLTFRHAGRDYRLTDVYGEVVKEILA